MDERALFSRHRPRLKGRFHGLGFHAATMALFALSHEERRAGGFRFFFFSREEPRMHVHALHAKGEAKFWLEPTIELSQNLGLSGRLATSALRLIREHEDEIRAAWKTYFGR